jgi:hypothetical protein
MIVSREEELLRLVLVFNKESGRQIQSSTSVS